MWSWLGLLSRPLTGHLRFMRPASSTALDGCSPGPRLCPMLAASFGHTTSPAPGGRQARAPRSPTARPSRPRCSSSLKTHCWGARSTLYPHPATGPHARPVSRATAASGASASRCLMTEYPHHAHALAFGACAVHLTLSRIVLHFTETVPSVLAVSPSSAPTAAAFLVGTQFYSDLPPLIRVGRCEPAHQPHAAPVAGRASDLGILHLWKLRLKEAKRGLEFKPPFGCVLE